MNPSTLLAWEKVISCQELVPRAALPGQMPNYAKEVKVFDLENYRMLGKPEPCISHKVWMKMCYQCNNSLATSIEEGLCALTPRRKSSIGKNQKTCFFLLFTCRFAV